MKLQHYFLSLAFLLSIQSVSGQEALFEQGKCIILSEENKPTAYIDTIYKGKRSLKLDGRKQSIALTKDKNVRNFRVEMDIAGEVMSGLGFRVQDKFNYRFIYFRPGMGGTREAIQYIPIYNGALSWVFYNYPIYETTADVSSLEWFHATFEVRGTNLKVFVDHGPEPQMDIQLLDSEVSGGNFMLRSLFGVSYFANITYEELSEDKPKISKPSTNTFLTSWEISEQFPRDSVSGHYDRLIKKADKSKNWKAIDHPQDKTVNFARYFKYPKGIVLARKKLSSDSDKNSMLNFDFVGRIKVMLNGQEVFNYQKIKFERMFDGTFRINLNLKKGNNELLVVTEGDAGFFGEGFKYLGRLQHTNWGFIARLED
ncbi:hypothetical protein [Ulvibacterium sp.]|uniref:hypothetical protein n=1 Tax=Ulvibacterium sp. TaxID=2665914 RepID=UPI002607F863|nr:hypothetical protein [Ulvibacterium sp.]